jgi:hypothetical protein
VIWEQQAGRRFKRTSIGFLFGTSDFMTVSAYSYFWGFCFLLLEQATFLLYLDAESFGALGNGNH